jgi:hypothetical protein
MLFRLKMFFRKLFAMDGGEFLCDRCKYNHPSTCSIRERPNVRKCGDYKAK